MSEHAPTEELWIGSPHGLTPDSYTVSYTKAPFRLTEVPPAGFAPTNMMELKIDFRVREKRLITTHIRISMIDAKTALVFKRWEETSDFTAEHRK